MNILLISQCRKNALTETRRILDQFAERFGDKVWKTPITQAGLEKLHQMLRQTARKNTAVACYWERGKRTELLWIVGDRLQFNTEGRVPTNRTKRNILHNHDESPWLIAYSIQIMTALSALLHDLGKANIGFQEKLQQKSKMRDTFRHEWISARLFEAMIQGCETDEQWLTRFTDWQSYQQQNPHWFETLHNDSISAQGFPNLPPLAQMLVWLITSHHHLPFDKQTADYLERKTTSNKQKYQAEKIPFDHFYTQALKPWEQWVKNRLQDNDKKKKTHDPQIFWKFNQFASDSQAWQKHLSRWARKALQHPLLMQLSAHQKTIQDPFFLLLTRLCLMLGDHSYSAAAHNPHLGEANFPLFANTDDQQQLKQKLDEHLIGVCKSAVHFARILPQLKNELPALIHHKFNVQTKIPRFKWQNKAFELAKAQQGLSEKQGFFGVNMASTGCGKTLANARIMYALSTPERGARFTIALGLRILTLQTAEALKSKLNLSEESLATLIGGNSLCHEHTMEKQATLKANEKNFTGRESDEDWFSENTILGGDFLQSAVNKSEFSALFPHNTKTQSLLYAPIVSCTIDHLISASETTRGGKHIIPLLRLLSSDLILDEPDDFGQSDLPALSRLVHLAGLFGSRILLSSATLTPDLIAGLFQAYQAGRKIYNQQQGQNASSPICCYWVDEKYQQAENCLDLTDFNNKHQQFTTKRAKMLQQLPPRHKAYIIDLPPLQKIENAQLDYRTLAETFIENAIKLHQRYHSTYQQQKVSIGLIRLAHINRIIPLAQQLFKMSQQEKWQDYQIHLCCYHSRQLLLLRSLLEQKLDRILHRTLTENTDPIFQQPEIIQALQHNAATHHIFIVLGSPVTEVGRDHDYDWAILEPSSTRSLIQLAGRVWRHRPERQLNTENIALLPTNLKGLQKNYKSSTNIFNRPGFEEGDYHLTAHQISKLIPAQQLQQINAIPRILKPISLDEKNQLADLEHKVMADLFFPTTTNWLTAYWQENLPHRLMASLSHITPFRQRTPKFKVIYSPDEENENWLFYEQTKNSQPVFSARISYQTLEVTSDFIQPWLTTSMAQALEISTMKLNNTNLKEIAEKYATAELPNHTEYLWSFNETLGFYQLDDI